MPLHDDDPTRPGNMSDEEYWAKTKELQDAVGNEGLHVVPEDILAAAIKRAKGQ